MTLKDLPIGQTAQIIKVGGNGELRQHFLDMGVIPGTEIKKIKLAPMGDPIEFEISGYELTMRMADAEKIEVSENTEKRFRQTQSPETRGSQLPVALHFTLDLVRAESSMPREMETRFLRAHCSPTRL